jgi:hypothetical protein
MRRLVAAAAVFTLACTAETPAPVADTSCFGTRILSYRDLVAEVVIPTGESCASGSYSIVFTRGADTLQTLTETRSGSVGFIGTADVDGDGRGEFFVATYSDDSTKSGTLYAYTDGTAGITRFTLAALTAEQLAGHTGNDRFGFGGADQLVRAFPRAAGDTAWFGYSHGESSWKEIARPAWVR